MRGLLYADRTETAQGADATMPHLEDMTGLFAVVLSLGIPIVAILTSHQQKMAKVFQENQRAALQNNPETQALREEIRELKSLVHQQSIAIDNIARPLPTDARLQDRVGG